MHVGLVGEETVVRVVAEQVREVATRITQTTVADLDEEDLVFVAAPTDDDRLHAANEVARSTGATLVTVESGGIGGRYCPGVESAIGVFAPPGACYRCLATRVASAAEGEAEVTSVDPTLHRVAGAIAGREAIRRLRADADDATASITEIPYATRSLLPVPGCETCEPEWSGRWTIPSDDDDRGRSLSDAIAAAEQAFDERLGPVTSIGEVASVPLPYYFARLAETAGFSDASAAARAAGVAEDWDMAFMKGLGECLERYAAGVYRSSTLTHARTEQVEGAIAPDAFVQPSSEEPITDAIPWIRAQDLARGEPRRVPAETVLFPPPERRIRPAITTGLALGNSRSEAALAGLGEVLERDAAMLAWYSGYDPLAVDVDDAAFEYLCRLGRVEELSVSTVLLTQDVDLPVIAAAVQRTTEWPRFAVGSAAGFDPIDAAISATREAIQNWMELDRMGAAEAERQSPRLAAYAEAPGAAGDFFESDASVAADRIDPGDPYSGTDGLERLISLASDAGMTPLASWLTTRDLRLLGFEAVRVVIPEAQPLFTGDAFFGERAKTVPRSMGYTPQLDRAPHPFP